MLEISAKDLEYFQLGLNSVFGLEHSSIMKLYLNWELSITWEVWDLNNSTTKVKSSVIMDSTSINSLIIVFWVKLLNGMDRCLTHKGASQNIREPWCAYRSRISSTNTRWSKLALSAKKTPSIVWNNGSFSEAKAAISTSWSTSFSIHLLERKKSLIKFIIDTQTNIAIITIYF